MYYYYNLLVYIIIIRASCYEYNLITPEIISHVALGNVVTMWHCDDITVPHCNNIFHAGTDHSANFNLSIKFIFFNQQ